MMHGEPRTGLEIINGAKITAVSAAADELRENGFDFRCIKKTDPSMYQLFDTAGARKLAEKLLREKGVARQENYSPTAADLNELYEERVAIMIVDGGLSEREARQQASIKRETRITRDGQRVTNYTQVAPKEVPATKEAAKQEEQLTWTFEEFRQQARQMGW